MKFCSGMSPLREALRRLAGQGIITIESYRGATVRRISPKDIRDLFLLREKLEGLAANLAASSGAGKRAKTRFNNLIERMRTLLDRDSWREYFDLSSPFHHLVAHCAENVILTEFIERLEQPTLRFQFRRSISPTSAAQSLSDHETIAHAIISGQPTKAERAMRRHVRRTRDAILAAARAE